MDGSYEHIIIGGGLAGSITAYHLSQHGPTLLLEKDKIGSGASGALSGLVNPFMSRKANPVWSWREALDAFEGLVDAAGMQAYYRQTGVLRPAAALPQKMLFRDVARSFPDDTSWLQPYLIKERWPAVSAENGALYVHRGGGVELEPFVRGVARAAEERGCDVKINCTAAGARIDGDHVIVSSSQGDFSATKVILCPGSGYRGWPQLNAMPFHPIRGQLVETPVPSDLTTDFPCLSGAGYIVPYGKRLILGSTFRHTFEGLAPTTEETEEIIRKTSTLLPVVRVAPIKKVWTGIRVTVPGTRLPVVGPTGGSDKIWVFTGLGSKGILMGSLIGSRMHDYLRDPGTIPPEISVV